MTSPICSRATRPCRGPEHLVAVLVDDLALLVHHVVVLEDALADQVVLLLDLALAFSICFESIFASIGSSSPESSTGPEAVEDAVDAVAGEQADEVVLGGRGRSATRPGLPAAGAATQLVVDPSRLVALRAADVQATGLEHLLLASSTRASMAGRISAKRSS
jgi:hypothetical protein